MPGRNQLRKESTIEVEGKKQKKNIKKNTCAMKAKVAINVSGLR